MLEKNLQAINNIALQRRLRKISPIESRIGITYCVTPSNDYVLLKDELPCDDLNNPREAIRKMFKENIKHKMETNDIIIGFGIGLGYILDEAFNTFPSRIYIYEPDLKLLHFVLQNVDMAEILSDERVFITNDLDELINKLSSTYLTKDKVEIIYLQNYAVVKNNELLMLTQKVFDSCKSKMVDINTITKFSTKWLLNTIENMATIENKNIYKLSDLENKFEGQTALIAAAGPSLKDNIEKIKANRDKFIIFAVNKSAKYLIQNEIIPDFIVCLDAGNMKKTLGNIDNSLANVNCIMDIRTDKYLTTKPFNKIFINFSETDFLMKKLSRFNTMKFYEAGGSASILALNSAFKMGFSKIVLAGVDLAFKDTVIYSSGETMERISQEEIIVDKVKKTLVQVPSIKGGTVYTREDYETYIHHFEALVKELKFDEIYNISSFGAYINGIKPAKFEEIIPYQKASLQSLAFVSPFKFKLQEFMQEEFFNINNIISMLSKGIFSTSLVNSIVKSVFIYQYMQSDVLNILQKNFDTELANEFIEKTKLAIKTVVNLLQKNKLI